MLFYKEHFILFSVTMVCQCWFQFKTTNISCLLTSWLPTYFINALFYKCLLAFVWDSYFICTTTIGHALIAAQRRCFNSNYKKKLFNSYFLVLLLLFSLFIRTQTQCYYMRMRYQTITLPYRHIAQLYCVVLCIVVSI